MDLISNGTPSTFDCCIPPKKLKQYFQISGGLVCLSHCAIQPHHLTILPILPAPAATLMMIIVECFNPHNHSPTPLLFVE